jgi:hypothetical protein
MGLPGMIENDGAVLSVLIVVKIGFVLKERLIPHFRKVVTLAGFEDHLLPVFSIRISVDVLDVLLESEGVVGFGEKQFAIVEEVVVRRFGGIGTGGGTRRVFSGTDFGAGRFGSGIRHRNGFRNVGSGSGARVGFLLHGDGLWGTVLRRNSGSAAKHSQKTAQ